MGKKTDWLRVRKHDKPSDRVVFVVQRCGFHQQSINTEHEHQSQTHSSCRNRLYAFANSSKQLQQVRSFIASFLRTGQVEQDVQVWNRWSWEVTQQTLLLCCGKGIIAFCSSEKLPFRPCHGDLFRFDTSMPQDFEPLLICHSFLQNALGTLQCVKDAKMIFSSTPRLIWTVLAEQIFIKNAKSLGKLNTNLFMLFGGMQSLYKCKSVLMTGKPMRWMYIKENH